MAAAMLPGSKKEFTVQEIVQTSREMLGNRKKAFSVASAGMMLKTLTDLGFIFRNRRGRYSFTVPLLDEFIVRQMGIASNLPGAFRRFQRVEAAFFAIDWPFFFFCQGPLRAPCRHGSPAPAAALLARFGFEFLGFLPGRDPHYLDGVGRSRRRGAFASRFP